MFETMPLDPSFPSTSEGNYPGDSCPPDRPRISILQPITSQGILLPTALKFDNQFGRVCHGIIEKQSYVISLLYYIIWSITELQNLLQLVLTATDRKRIECGQRHHGCVGKGERAP